MFFLSKLDFATKTLRCFEHVGKESLNLPVKPCFSNDPFRRHWQVNVLRKTGKVPANDAALLSSLIVALRFQLVLLICYNDIQ